MHPGSGQNVKYIQPEVFMLVDPWQMVVDRLQVAMNLRSHLEHTILNTQE